MLNIAQPDPKQTLDAAAAKGGFLWWYTDLRTPSGDGLVVIWSLGLPFLPGARANLPAKSRPAVSVAHYRGGKQHLYLLQDYLSGDAELDLTTGSGVIGRSSYEVAHRAGNVDLVITLNEPIPSSNDRLRGEVRVSGPAAALPASQTAHAHHIWAPKTVHAKGHATLNYGGQVHHLTGSAYVDSNVSDTPLYCQGIRSWQWGRIAFPAYTLVYYEVEESQGARLRYLYRQRADEGLKRLGGRLTFGRFERGFYGLKVPREVVVEAPDCSICSETVTLVEDGPFYTRGLLSARDESGDKGVGYCETVVPGKIDQPWQRPLVRMRTHQVGGQNSFFLPLFTGPKKGRADRLLTGIQKRRTRPAHPVES